MSLCRHHHSHGRMTSFNTNGYYPLNICTQLWTLNDFFNDPLISKSKIPFTYSYTHVCVCVNTKKERRRRRRNFSCFVDVNLSPLPWRSCNLSGSYVEERGNVNLTLKGPRDPKYRLEDIVWSGLALLQTFYNPIASWASKYFSGLDLAM